MTMIDTPEGIAFFRALARKGLLEAEVETGRPAKSGQTTYSIVKQVYGFRGSRKSVLEDLTEYIDAEQRLRELPDGIGEQIVRRTQEVADRLDSNGQLTQANFEAAIARAEARGAISYGFRQAMSDLFYVTIVRQNAGNK